jgi:hypothetical protein
MVIPIDSKLTPAGSLQIVYHPDNAAGALAGLCDSLGITVLAYKIFTFVVHFTSNIITSSLLLTLNARQTPQHGHETPHTTRETPETDDISPSGLTTPRSARLG